LGSYIRHHGPLPLPQAKAILRQVSRMKPSHN
jgi:hypothetical protein